MNMTRPCPVPDCSAAVKPNFLMCRDCWRLVPGAIQKRVYSTWRALQRAPWGSRDRLFRGRDYDAARLDAIKAVMRERGIALPDGVPAEAAP